MATALWVLQKRVNTPSCFFQASHNSKFWKERHIFFHVMFIKIPSILRLCLQIVGNIFLDMNHAIDSSNFSIFFSTSDTSIKEAESIFIHKLSPSLNSEGGYGINIQVEKSKNMTIVKFMECDLNQLFWIFVDSWMW